MEEYRPYASKMREDLYRSLKMISAAEGKPIQTLIEEAVTQYLANRKFTEEPHAIKEEAGRYTVSFEISKEPKKPKSK